jgi:hypothetical protein
LTEKLKEKLVKSELNLSFCIAEKPKSGFELGKSGMELVSYGLELGFSSAGKVFS